MDVAAVYRPVSRLVRQALADTRVVYVQGARQVGKSTLVEAVAAQVAPMALFTLDDQVTLDTASRDPVGFIAGLPRPVVIDEIQRVPDLLLAVKAAVDRDKRPGQFLLTGSSNIKDNRKVKDVLTGRVEILTLAPLTQAELHGTQSTLIDALFAGAPPQICQAVVGHGAFVEAVLQGGYPEARLRTGRRRERWFASYIETTLDRDLRDLSDAIKLSEMPRLVKVLAAQASGLLNYQTVAGKLGLSPATVKSYVQLLKTAFLVDLVPSWRPGLGNREAHTPKVRFVDSGLLTYLLGADSHRIRHDPQVTGAVLENFVAGELRAQAEWADTRVEVYHYRFDRDEVDVVMEDRSGRVVGVEVKAAASLVSADSRGLVKLRDRLGEKFVAGIVIYTGSSTIPLGERLWAEPVSSLWASVSTS